MTDAVAAVAAVAATSPAAAGDGVVMTLLFVRDGEMFDNGFLIDEFEMACTKRHQVIGREEGKLNLKIGTLFPSP
jgi:hypothetical protein